MPCWRPWGSTLPLPRQAESALRRVLRVVVDDPTSELWLALTESWMAQDWKQWDAAARRVADLSKEEFKQRWQQMPVGRLRDQALRLRFRYHQDEFLRYCFPSVFNRPWNKAHLALLARPATRWQDLTRIEKHQALLPRGIGKTTVGKGRVAHVIVYGLHRFRIVLGVNIDEAKAWADLVRTWFRVEDDGSRRLHRLYGPFTVSGTDNRFTVGAEWGPEPTCTTVLCRPWTSSVHGANELGHRPDGVDMDDVEHRVHVRSPVQRAKSQSKLNQEVLKLGDPGRGMEANWNCTVNHPDSISERIRQGREPNVGWKVVEFPAIEAWPERTDLWDRAKRIYLDLELSPEPEVREACAQAFYEANREEMDQGVQLLDPVALDAFKCHVKIWSEGLTAFMTEMQHVTRIPGANLFNSEGMLRCRVERHELHGWVIYRPRIHTVGERAGEFTGDEAMVKLSECRRLIRVDPIPGEALTNLTPEGDGDFAAVAVLARDKAGYTYSVDCRLGRWSDVRLLEQVWSAAETYGVNRCTVESNGFARLVTRDLEREKVRRREAGLYWHVTFEAIVTSTNKEDDIAALEQPVQGWLYFSQLCSPLLFQQFDAFPGGDHDDGPDAVARGYQDLNNAPTPPSMGQNRLR